jgi:hypothetical protein
MDGAFMEPVAAISGKQRQIARPQERRKRAQTVAVRGNRLPFGRMGKEGRRFESVRGLCKRLRNGGSFSRTSLHELQFAVDMEPLWKPGDPAPAGAPGRCTPFSLRPLGRHGEHGEQDGVAWDARHDPDHAHYLRASAKRLRDRADRARRHERQGRGRNVAPPRS